MEIKPFKDGPPHGPPAAEEPADSRFRLLCNLLATAFAGVILVNTALTFHFWYQTKLVRAQLAHRQEMLWNYQRFEAPVLRDLLAQLEGYSQQNRDYQPIAQKYSMLFRYFQTAATNAAPRVILPAPPKNPPPGAPPSAPTKK
jgi:hypothetical protein